MRLSTCKRRLCTRSKCKRNISRGWIAGIMFSSCSGRLVVRIWTIRVKNSTNTEYEMNNHYMYIILTYIVACTTAHSAAYYCAIAKHYVPVHIRWDVWNTLIPPFPQSSRRLLKIIRKKHWHATMPYYFYDEK